MLSPLMIEAEMLQNVLESFVGNGKVLAGGTLVLHEHQPSTWSTRNIGSTYLPTNEIGHLLVLGLLDR